jgi:hypothetical protein
MALYQQYIWAAMKKKSGRPVSAESGRPKRRISAAGRRRIIEATRKRWAAYKQQARAKKTSAKW